MSEELWKMFSGQGFDVFGNRIRSRSGNLDGSPRHDSVGNAG